MIVFRARRLDSDGMSIIGRWLDPAGDPLCWSLEPGFLREPHPAIPAKRYPLRLRTVGAKHAEYLAHYGPAFHQGMIEIADVPGREGIELHVGNSIADTLGCSLAGTSAIAPKISSSQHWEVAGSRVAYERAYPVLRDAVLADESFLEILPMGMS